MKASEIKTKEDYIQHQSELIDEFVNRELKYLDQIRILLKRLVTENNNECIESMPSENGNTPYKAPLTNVEIRKIIDDMEIPVKIGKTATRFARAIEKAHGIG